MIIFGNLLFKSSQGFTIPYQIIHPEQLTPPIDTIKLTFINHSSWLIQYPLNILIDPIFSNRASPFPFIGPKRYHPTPLPIESLPRIDVLFISHNHYDHMDKSTLKRIMKVVINQYALQDWVIITYYHVGDASRQSVWIA